MFFHAASTPMPTGETMPIPVTTTRRLGMDACTSDEPNDALRSRAATAATL
jgi:hypothetical protein